VTSPVVSEMQIVEPSSLQVMMIDPLKIDKPCWGRNVSW